MPENDTRNVKTARTTTAASDQSRAQPHSVGAFWRLFGLFGRQTRPVGYDAGFESPGASDASSYRELDRLSSLSADRRRRYDIFDEMDSFGLVSSILSVYAEEATQPDYDKGVRVWIESQANHMIDAGTACLQNCKVEDTVFPVTRRVAKYGDGFQRLVYASEKGVLNWRYASQSDMSRREDKYGRLVGFQEKGVKFRKALHPDSSDTSFPWDYIHARMLGKNEEDGYGTGFCEQFFREWRNMTLTEDSILVYRLRRMPDRNVVLVDVGSLEDHEAMRYVNQWRKRLRKHELIDPANAKYRKQFNPLTPYEDFFYPVRQDSNTRIETLQGGGNIGEIFDLEHFRDAFFGAAAAPKAYFGFEGEINAKATLQQQDIRFARSAKRLQRATVHALRQLLDVHYTLLGTPENGAKYDPTARGNEYLVMMSAISYLDEFERLELVRMRFEIVQTMSGLKSDLQLDARMWAIYILINFAKLPEDMVMRLVQQTSPEPVEGRGSDFDKLTREQKAQVLDNENATADGVSDVLDAEQIGWVERCYQASPRLRMMASGWASLAQEERENLIAQQTDPSLTPVKVAGGANYLLTDDYNESPEIKELNEDVRVLREAMSQYRTVEIPVEEGQSPTDEQVLEAIASADARAKTLIESRRNHNQKLASKSGSSKHAGASTASAAIQGRAYEARTTGDLSR